MEYLKNIVDKINHKNYETALKLDNSIAYLASGSQDNTIKIWKYDFVLNMNVHEMHTALAHKIDKRKMKLAIYKQNQK